MNNLKQALELRKATHKYIRRERGKDGRWKYIYEEKKSKVKYYFITSNKLRYTNVNNFKSGDYITVDKKYIIHLKKEKYNIFSLESSIENYNTSKYIDPYYWPTYIDKFLHGEYKK